MIKILAIIGLTLVGVWAYEHPVAVRSAWHSISGTANAGVNAARNYQAKK
jgi:hypothetical protein